MLDFPLMLWVKLLSVADRIQPKSNKFATGVENKATGDSKCNDSPDVFVKLLIAAITAINNYSLL